MIDCPDCNAGYSETFEQLRENVCSLMWKSNVTSEYKEITTFLAGRSPCLSILGHDSLDAYAAVTKIGNLAGLPDGWEICKTCNGEAEIPLDNSE